MTLVHHLVFFFIFIHLGRDWQLRRKEEKKKAKNHFGSLDRDWNGKVSHAEHKAMMNSPLRWCDDCERSIPGDYYSCLTCEQNEPDTYALCFSCYGQGEFEHHHPRTDLLDNHSMRNLLAKKMSSVQFSQPTDVEARRKQDQTYMDDIHKIAKAYYARATEEEKEKAKNYFRSLDGNCDGKISFAEYMNMVSQHYANDTMFNSFDRNSDGSLDFEEVLVLHFVHNIYVMRWCNACSGSLPGLHFSCLTCEKNEPNTYDLCCSCYDEGKFEHHHTAASFLDNYSMRNLLTKKMNSVQLSQPTDNQKKDTNMQEHKFHNAKSGWGDEEVAASSVSRMFTSLMSWFVGED